MLPRLDELRKLLEVPGGTLSPVVTTCIDENVTDPLERFLSGGKALRAKVVEAGFLLGRGSGALSEDDRRACACLAECVEAIHAGSLIVDDIQDNSQRRRGAPALHRTQGIPVALNSGNLLYFLGMTRIHAAGLPASAELCCSRRLHEALLRAHYGQALDVGIRVDEIAQAEVYDVCVASMYLKTGVLVALALTLGAMAADMPGGRVDRLDRFGHLLGVGLQMFDDVNNAACGAGDRRDAKRLEDLRLRRPTWVWAYAARHHDSGAYEEFVASVHRLPDERPLNAWFARHDFERQARQAACAFVDAAFREYDEDLRAAGADSAREKLLSVARLFSQPPPLRDGQPVGALQDVKTD